jgi:hypothetical protein
MFPSGVAACFVALLYTGVVQHPLEWEPMHLAATEASSKGLLLEVLKKAW